MPASLSSFIDGSHDDNSTPDKIKTWMQTVFDNHLDGAKKNQIISYFSNLIEQDDSIIRHAQFKVSAAKHKMKELNTSLEHPVEHVDDLLTTVSLTDTQKIANIATILTTDNGQAYPGELTFPDYITINGDNITLIGSDNAQPARTIAGGLASTTICLKGIRLQGKNIVVKGVHFRATDNTIPFDFHCVTFTGPTENVTFVNCLFEGPLYTNSETVWWHGGTEVNNVFQHYLEGNVTIKNCRIHNFRNWMLMDANTQSNSTLQVPLKNVLFTENLLTGDVDATVPGVGSIAFRGKVDDPGQKAVCTHNRFKFQCHNLFWDALEVNNFERIYVADNDFENLAGEDSGSNDTKGFFQAWSKAGVFTFQAERNSMRGVRVGYALALGNVGATPVFYGCTPESYIKITAADVAAATESMQLDNAVSLLYPFNGVGSTQQVISGQLPTITNTSGLPVVTQASEWIDSAVTSHTVPSDDDDVPGAPLPDLTAGDPPLIETFSFATEAELTAKTFDIGTNTSGYIIVNNTAILDASVVAWFEFNVSSTVIQQNPQRQWLDQVVLPDGVQWRIINQVRSWNNGVMTKRNQLNNQGGATYADVPADSEFFFKMYFKILD